MLHGKVADVTTRNVGAEVVVASTGTLVQVDNAAPFDVTGGSVVLDGVVIPYLSADPDADTLTLVDATTVLEGDRLEADPALPVTTALVIVDEDGEGVSARVPHSMKARLVEGLRDDPSTAETVELSWEGSGSGLVVSDVLGQSGSQSWGDPDGRGTDVGEAGVIVRDTLVVDSMTSLGDVKVAGMPLVGTALDGSTAVGWLDRFSAGLIETDNFTTISKSRATGEEWGYAAISATCRAGRMYRVAVSVAARPNVTGGTCVVLLRVGEGVEATLTSTTRARVDLGPASSPANVPAGYAETFLSYTVDTEIDVLVTYQGGAGATPQMVSASPTIIDMGPQGQFNGGSLRPLKPASTVDPDPDPQPTTPTKRRYTSVWRASDSATYRQSGSKRTDASDLVQGYVAAGSVNGHNQAAFVFTSSAITGETSKTIGGALSGATLIKAEVWVYFNGWYNSAGGTARLGKLGSSSLPTTLNATASVSRSGWKESMGQWVTVPTFWFSDGNRGVTLGGGTSRLSEYYGRAQGVSGPTTKRPRCRLTYSR